LPRPNILVVSTLSSPFILEDVDLLRKHANVEHLVVHGIRAPLKIAAAVRRADAVLTWFVSVYAAAAVGAARKSAKRSVLIAAGADVADVPFSGYGPGRNHWKRRAVGWALRHADAVLAVDDSLVANAARLGNYDGANIRTVPTGYDPDRWFPAGRKEPLVLTVAGCETEARLKVKGVDFLLQVARTLPDVRFVLVGLHQPLLGRIEATRPQNMELLPYRSRGDLLPLYQRAKAYCQPSMSEGLPNSLCEAMLCGCSPVGTAVGGIPAAIGETGRVVPYGDVDQMQQAIGAALLASPQLAESARTRITRKYPLAAREAALLAYLGIPHT
jgi:glycosyltransferase involved in cell wall biosynthesis